MLLPACPLGPAGQPGDTTGGDTTTSTTVDPTTSTSGVTDPGSPTGTTQTGADGTETTPAFASSGTTSAGTETTSASTETTSAGSGTETGADTDTGEPVDPCEASDAVLYSLPYVTNVSTRHASCVLTNLATEVEGSLRVELKCGADDELFFIRPELVPDLTPWLGATLELDAYTNGGFDGMRELELVVLREAGKLVYAGGRIHALIPEDFPAGLYAPLTLEPVFGLCALQTLHDFDTGNTGGGDGFQCEQVAGMQLGVSAGDRPQVLLASGQSTEIAVAGGTYRIDVRRMVRGVDCEPDYPPGNEDTYAYAIAFVPG